MRPVLLRPKRRQPHDQLVQQSELGGVQEYSGWLERASFEGELHFATRKSLIA
jgi:hypothetical protein